MISTPPSLVSSVFSCFPLRFIFFCHWWGIHILTILRPRSFHLFLEFPSTFFASNSLVKLPLLHSFSFSPVLFFLSHYYDVLNALFNAGSSISIHLFFFYVNILRYPIVVFLVFICCFFYSLSAVFACNILKKSLIFKLQELNYEKLILLLKLKMTY